jgi:predicted ATPase
VHLHPEWQVRYAKLIVYLIKERSLSILITSHSPYMIEALSKFSKEEWVKASFYLSEDSKNWKCTIEDKTEDQNYILDKLVEPFEKLVWN